MAHRHGRSCLLPEIALRFQLERKGEPIVRGCWRSLLVPILLGQRSAWERQSKDRAGHRVVGVGLGVVSNLAMQPRLCMGRREHTRSLEPVWKDRLVCRLGGLAWDAASWSISRLDCAWGHIARSVCTVV